MAFNPFHAFRKHQKVVFAVLTIICMLTFVMAGGSFAGGDFFSELTRWISGRGRTNEVATIYGRRISDRDLQELRRRRRLANEFMVRAVLQAQQIIIGDVEKSLEQFDPSIRGQLQQMLQKRFSAMIGFEDPSDYLKYLQQVFVFQLQFIDNQLETAKKPAEQEKIRHLAEAFQLDSWLLHRPKDELYPEENLYFGGSLSDKGLVDFMIWQHQADRLGIQLLINDIRMDLYHETLKVDLNSLQILRQLEVQPDTTTQQLLLAALGDEFRVRMAQSALVGYNPGGHFKQTPASLAVPALITPYAFWQYYRTNRTELSLNLLPVSAQKFIPEVKEQPTDEELNTLFSKYKDEEYDPSRETPGFKQPRRVRLEWVTASADSDLYRKQAEQWLLFAVASTPVNPILPLAMLKPLANEYTYLIQLGRLRASPLTVRNFAYSLYDYAYLNRAENVAATVGQVLETAVLQQRNSLFSTVAAYQSAAVARTQKELAPLVDREAQRRLRPLLSLSGAVFGTGTSVQPSLALAGVWDGASVKLDQELPIELVKGQIIRKLQENLAGTLLASGLDAFKKDLEEVRKELESRKIKLADAEKRVDEAAKTYGLQIGAKTDLQDKYQVNRDTKELAPLKETYKRNTLQDPKGKSFANLFFNPPSDPWKPFTPRELRSGLSLDVSEKKTFLYWKLADQPAKVLSFSEARPQVEAAWRLEKARVLAKAKAEELAKQAHDAQGNYLLNLNEAAKQYGKVFDLNGVARLVRPRPSSLARPFASYEPYTVPEENIEYPPAGLSFVDTLLEALHRRGDTVVISNRPKDVYYVVALADRHEPTTEDFYRESDRNRHFLLAQMLEPERQNEYREAFLKRLREEANLSEEMVQRLNERPSPRGE